MACYYLIRPFAAENKMIVWSEDERLLESYQRVRELEHCPIHHVSHQTISAFTITACALGEGNGPLTVLELDEEMLR